MKRNLPLALSAALAVAGMAATLQAQSAHFPPQTVELTSLRDFRGAGANWRVAGGASADLARPLALTAEPGTGVLVNLPTETARTHLVTGWEHGDLELSLDFMLPRGSNSGVYLMGRYELQLLDSWGVRTPSFADAGGIYQRWDARRGAGREGFEGHAPLQNASRAPGLWQRLEVDFRAPRFDARGRKLANARFAQVRLNGVVVQENVELTGPTRGAAFPNERPSGPLLIQGDHGPVALRNLRYKRYSGEQARLSGLKYRAWADEQQMNLEFVAGRAPAREGAADAISSGLATAQDKFALAYDGTLTVPRSGRYLFQLNLEWVDANPQFQGKVVGGGRLLVGGREVLVHPGREKSAVAEVELRAGQHPFSLTYYKNRPWTDQREITLYVEGPGMARQALHDEAAVRQTTPPGAIVVDGEAGPVVLRSFVRHGATKRVHAASVADPVGAHYSVDLEQGALLYAWRGPFMETTQMWHDRGDDQIAEPLGSVLALPGTPTLAVLDGEGAAWPDSLGAEQGFTRRGYRLDPDGRPTFRYRLRGVEVEDRIRPEGDGTSLRRELRLRSATPVAGLHVQLARGERVTRQADGTWVVGDRAYYVALPAGAPQPVVRSSEGGQELLLPVRLDRGEASIAYSIIW